MKLKIEEAFGKALPAEYVQFLKNNPEGGEKMFSEYKDEDPDDEGREWELMGDEELVTEWEMNDVGTAANYESIKLYTKMQREFMGMEEADSNVGEIKLDRVDAGLVIGSENGDYLYLDSEDGYSVWIYYPDGGDVLRIADSFQEFMGE